MTYDFETGRLRASKRRWGSGPCHCGARHHSFGLCKKHADAESYKRRVEQRGAYWRKSVRERCAPVSMPAAQAQSAMRSFMGAR